MSRSADESRGKRFSRTACWIVVGLVLATVLYAILQWRSGESSRDRWGAPALASTAAWLLAAFGVSHLLAWSGRRLFPNVASRVRQRLWAVRWQMLASVASLILSLAVAEFVLRQWVPTPRFKWLHDYSASGFDQNDWQKSFCEFDPLLGWRGLPDRRDWFTRPTFRVWVEQNSAGFRDIEHDREASARSHLVVLGDSFVWGCGVEQHETVTAQLRDRLTDIEVFNLGICGYGTDQSLLNLCRWSSANRPDRVCYLFFANDISDNQSSFKHGHSKPCFSLENGKLRLAAVPSREESDGNKQGQRSAAPSPIQLLAHPGLSIRRAADYYVSPRSVLYRHIRRIPQSGRHEPEIIFPDPLTQALVLQMKQQCEQLGAEFTMALIPDRKVMQYSDPSVYFAAVREWSREQEIDCLDLTDSLVVGPKHPYLGEGHWNAEGHRVAAAAIAEHVRMRR